MFASDVSPNAPVRIVDCRPFCDSTRLRFAWASAFTSGSSRVGGGGGGGGGFGGEGGDGKMHIEKRSFVIYVLENFENRKNRKSFFFIAAFREKKFLTFEFLAETLVRKKFPKSAFGKIRC